MAELGGAPDEVSVAAWKLLQDYDWPGNVRQLKYLVHALVDRCKLTGQRFVTRHDVELLLPRGVGDGAGNERAKRFESYMQDGFGYDSVKARFLSAYVHFQHEQVSNGEKTKLAYAKTAQVLNCSVSTVKERLADYRRFFESDM
jgi:DNA-binding NtrC family response regulator